MMKHQEETIINHYRVNTLVQFLVRAAVATEHVSVPKSHLACGLSS